MAFCLSALLTNSFAADLAEVDGVKITEADFGSLKSQFPDFDFNKLSQDQKLRLINQKINEILMDKDAKAKKLDKTKSYEEGLNILKIQMRLNAWQQEIIEEANKTKIPESELKAFYDANPNQFIEQEGEARHILVRTKAEAEKIINELNKTKSSQVLAKFIELANKNTVDPGGKHAQNGGSLGTFQRNQMVPEFAKSTFDLKPGTYSKTPIKTDFGYHVVYLIKKSEPKVISFNDAKANIENLFRERNAQNLIQKRIQELRDKAKITIN